MKTKAHKFPKGNLPNLFYIPSKYSGMLITVVSVILITYIFRGCCDKDHEIKKQMKFSDESHGCSSFIVYKIGINPSDAIAVIGKRDSLNLSLQEKTFNLKEINPDNLRIEIKEFTGDAGNYYCNDVPDMAGKLISTWKARSGFVNIAIVQDSIFYDTLGPVMYKLNVILKNILFENENKKQITIDNLGFKDVLVGWLPG